MIGINNKLFMVEGLPGSGKSAAAEYVADFLTTSGVGARWYEEKDLGHPADYTFHAFMREDQIKKLAPGEQRQVYSEGIKKQSGYVVPLTKISVSLFEKILPYKIYGRLDWETEKAVMRERWREFADECRSTDTVHVFDGCFLQNPVGEMMLRFDLVFQEIEDYIWSIYDVIACLEPVVIYLRSTDIGKRVGETLKEKGRDWLETMVEAHTAGGYGRHAGLTGLEGYIACLRERQRRELDILDRLPVKRLIISDPCNDWDGFQARLDAYLKSLNGIEARA